ncbi:type I-E CRISPR-associated protein Cas6/Cse3/CasE [Azomonas macrocytogenes]|uniref:CRISPR system Cascade subunit CasE n=1 Tax=Azomonas macrocytogenes TaxID=69962 RepID=A0A839SWG3_AZOMA|nr:type I-E CRISPR-associated protein Cas6/Cse3/CasE [Azomonas macrocytogenes]MBB3101731.1 CRISPR system Cascade subunit CasE [Azomonas macrocytogenes]
MTYYFSRVRLVAQLTRNEWLRDLARHGEPYRDHALIWRLFPGDGLPRDFIFRSLDERTYYVVSARLPQTQDGLFEVQSKSYQPRLQMGEWLRFDLRANPTVSRREPGKASQRHDVLMDAKRRAKHLDEVPLAQEAAGREWLMKRAENWGLAVQPQSLMQDGYRQHRLNRKGYGIGYSTLDYQGVAQVIEPDRLCKALQEGVGHSKGFGCGLLLIKRLE